MEREGSPGLPAGARSREKGGSAPPHQRLRAPGARHDRTCTGRAGPNPKPKPKPDPKSIWAQVGTGQPAVGEEPGGGSARAQGRRVAGRADSRGGGGAGG